MQVSLWVILYFRSRESEVTSMVVRHLSLLHRSHGLSALLETLALMSLQRSVIRKACEPIHWGWYSCSREKVATTFWSSHEWWRAGTLAWFMCFSDLPHNSLLRHRRELSVGHSWQKAGLQGWVPSVGHSWQKAGIQGCSCNERALDGLKRVSAISSQALKSF